MREIAGEEIGVVEVRNKNKHLAFVDKTHGANVILPSTRKLQRGMVPVQSRTAKDYQNIPELLKRMVETIQLRRRCRQRRRLTTEEARRHLEKQIILAGVVEQSRESRADKR